MCSCVRVRVRVARGCRTDDLVREFRDVRQAEADAALHRLSMAALSGRGYAAARYLLHRSQVRSRARFLLWGDAVARGPLWRAPCAPVLRRGVPMISHALVRLCTFCYHPSAFSLLRRHCVSAPSHADMCALHVCRRPTRVPGACRTT